MHLTLLFDIVSLVGFGLLILLVYRTQRNLLGHPARVFLTIFAGLYLMAGVANLLRHGGITTFLARYEYIAELLFPPLFLFFIFPIFSLYIFSLFMKQDMMQRMQAEEGIRESEARYRHLFEHSLEGRCLMQDGKIVAANRPMLKLFGAASLEDLAAEPLAERIESGQKGEFCEFLESVAVARDALCCQEYEVVRPDGSRRQMEMMAGTVDLGTEKALQCSFHDITLRTQAEVSLKRAKEEWERTFEAVPDLVAILDKEGRVLRVNRAFASHLDCTPEHLVGVDFEEAVHRNSGEGLETMPVRQQNGMVMPAGEQYEHSSRGHYLVSMTPLRDEHNTIIGYVRVARDITELKTAEKKLQDAQAFLQSIIDGVTDSIMVIDHNHDVLLMNDTVSRVHAVPRDDERSLKCHRVSHQREEPCQGDEHPCPLETVLADGSPKTFLHKHLKHDGSDFMLEIVASPVRNQQGEVTGIIEVGRDVTVKMRLEEEKKRLEERIVHQQQEQAIAVLARGMAHDFNNLLGSIQAGLELLEMEEAGESKRSVLAVMENSTQRMVELTNQLMAYAKEGKYQDRELSLPTLIDDVLAAIGIFKKPTLRVEKTIATDLWPIQADPGQIRQLFANVLVNAIEAMESDGGLLYIEADNRLAKEEWECHQHQLHPAGDYVHFCVRDTGKGISSDMAGQLFDPFVSTKGLGRGLGLAAAIGIVHNHGGCMTAQSFAGKGTAFHIFLPRLSSNSPARLIF